MSRAAHPAPRAPDATTVINACRSGPPLRTASAMRSANFGVRAAMPCGRRSSGLLSSMRFAHSLPAHTIFLPAGSSTETPASKELPPGDTPLACILGWVGTREKIMRKYTQIYNDHGVDVIAVLLKPHHVYQPVSKGLHTTEHIIDALTAPDTIDRPVLIQGFSAGAYMYGNLLTALDARGDAGLAFTKRIKGFVFDSPVDIDGVPFGLSRAIFGNDSEGTLKQRAVQALLETYLSPSLPMRQYYQASSDAMHGETFSSGFSSPLAVPSAFLFSDEDSVTVTADIRTVMDKWRAVGSDVEEVVFEGTKHVMHLQGFPAKYERAVANVVLKAFGARVKQPEG